MAWIYIVTSRWRTTLYIGATENLVSRVAQHKNRKISGFSKRYNTCCLVYAEEWGSIELARAREKTIKGWKRFRKEALISGVNPDWKELSLT